MMTKDCTYSNTKSTNKMEKIAQLIQEAKDDSGSPIIKELETWQQKYAAELTQEAVKELAIILIRNYLKPCADPASLFMKISLPEIFDKQELEYQLEKGGFSAEEKADFEKHYLKGTIPPPLQYNLAASTSFFSSVNLPEIQANILSNLPSQDLIKLTPTSKLTQKIIAGILFDRSDTIAFSFQTKTLKRWFDRLLQGEPVDSLFSEEEKKPWIERLSRHLRKVETVGASKIHCALLLQCLWDNNFEKICKCLTDTVSKVQTLAAPSAEEVPAVLYENEREDFLNLLGFGTKFKEEEIEAILDDIKTDKIYKTVYARLIQKVTSFNDEQLNRAVLLCFERSLKIGQNPAKITLDHLMKYVFHLTKDTQAVFVKTIEDVNQVGNYDKDFKDDCAFLVLLQLAQNNNPEIFAQLTRLVSARLHHTNPTRAYYWLSLLAPHLKEIDDHLISTLIKNINPFHSENEKLALTAIAKKLTRYQLAQYSYQCLSLLGENRGFKIISVLAASFSPCPYDIIQQLLSKDGQEFSLSARDALLELEPSILVLQSGILEKILTLGYDCAAVYKYLIKLAPLLSSQDFTENFIKILISSKQAKHCEQQPDFLALKKKALALVGAKLKDQQIDSYVASCMQYKEPRDALSYLQAISPSRLAGKLGPLFTNYSNALKDKSEFARTIACQAIPYFELFSALFPDNFLTDFIELLNDESNIVRRSAYESLAKILHLIKKDDLDDVFKQLFAHIDTEQSREAVCKCFILLAPRLSQQSITKAKDLLLASLNLTKGEERASIFSALTRIAHSLDAKELTCLIKSKCNRESYKYVRDLIEILPKDAIELVLKTSLEMLEKDSVMRADASLTLVKIAGHTQDQETHRKIIAGFISRLGKLIDNALKQPTDKDLNKACVAVLDHLIKLADLITEEEFKTIKNLPVTGFEMIASLYVLETLYNTKRPAENPVIKLG